MKANCLSMERKSYFRSFPNIRKHLLPYSVIQRFFRGLLGDEGYLMHTLPVSPWQLIGSKLLCAVVTTLLSIVVAILSILLIMPISWINILDMFS